MKSIKIEIFWIDESIYLKLSQTQRLLFHIILKNLI